MAGDVPATCPTGGVTAGSHGPSRSRRKSTCRSANPQVTTLQRYRLPKLTALAVARARAHYGAGSGLISIS